MNPRYFNDVGAWKVSDIKKLNLMIKKELAMAMAVAIQLFNINISIDNVFRPSNYQLNEEMTMTMKLIKHIKLLQTYNRWIAWSTLMHLQHVNKHAKHCDNLMEVIYEMASMNLWRHIVTYS